MLSAEDSVRFQGSESGAIGKRAGHASRRTLHGLDALNFFLADVQTGVGPFMAIYLQQHRWNPEAIGMALMAGGIAGIAMQTPAGALIDRLRSKRLLIAFGALALATGALAMAFRPTFAVVLSGQVLIGGISSIFNPAIAAIALGLVGHGLFDGRQGRNQSLNSAGNVVAAVSMGALGFMVSMQSTLYFVAAMAVPTVLCLLLIRPDEIDYELARGAPDGHEAARAGWKELIHDRALLIFLGCAVLFHFANAAMLPLLGEMLSLGKGRSSALFMSACIVTTQLVITLLAWPAGRLAERFGRKPLLLIGFGVLPIREVLYTLTHHSALLVGIQVLDGIGAGIFNVLAVIVIADLTRGTGRFNITPGVVFTAVGIGASLSQFIAGYIVHHFGFNAGFLFLAAVAALAFCALLLFMPETQRD